MTTATCATTWELPRESNEWVGPIDITKYVASTGDPVTDPVKFAVLPAGTRPGRPTLDPTNPANWVAPWADAVVDPDLTGDIGVQPGSVASPGTWGIWAVCIGASEQPVLDPSQVGFIKRT